LYRGEAVQRSGCSKEWLFRGVAIWSSLCREVSIWSSFDRGVVVMSSLYKEFDIRGHPCTEEWLAVYSHREVAVWLSSNRGVAYRSFTEKGGLYGYVERV